MKLKNILIISFIAIGIVTFSSFSTFHHMADEIAFVVTVEANDAATPMNFNIAISEDKGETTDFKMLENQRTPFEIKLQNANYLIVVHKTSEKGNIISKVEKHRDGDSKASASTEGNVMVLTIEKDGKVTSFGMD